jgi:hypothetical protein
VFALFIATVGSRLIFLEVQTEVTLVFLHSGLDGRVGVTNLDLTTRAGHTIRTRSLNFQAVFQRPKITGNFFGGRHTDLLFSAQNLPNSEECRSEEEEKGDRERFLRGQCSSLLWVEIP